MRNAWNRLPCLADYRSRLVPPGRGTTLRAYALTNGRRVAVTTAVKVELFVLQGPRPVA